VKSLWANAITSPVPGAVPEKAIRIPFAPPDEPVIVVDEKQNAFWQFRQNFQAIL
jgi:hypothetical protein